MESPPLPLLHLSLHRAASTAKHTHPALYSTWIMLPNSKICAIFPPSGITIEAFSSTNCTFMAVGWRITTKCCQFSFQSSKLKPVPPCMCCLFCKLLFQQQVSPHKFPYMTETEMLRRNFNPFFPITHLWDRVITGNLIKANAVLASKCISTDTEKKINNNIL